MNTVNTIIGRQSHKEFTKAAAKHMDEAELVIVITGRKVGDRFILDQRMTLPDNYVGPSLTQILEHAAMQAGQIKPNN